MTDWCRARSDARHFFTELHELQRRWDPLSHPFYLRWSEGELIESALTGYACEYEHVVVARAAALRSSAQIASPAARAELAHYIDDSNAAVRQWQRFREAVGGIPVLSPRAETANCLSAWTARGFHRLHATLALNYILAFTESRVAVAMCDVLAWRDAVEREAMTLLHLYARRQHSHARLARRHLEPRLHRAIAPQLLARADAALANHWQLLSALERDHAGVFV